MRAAQHIVFFDGTCGFCNRSVDFLIRVDHDETLLFAPLQGSTAKGILPEERRENLDTICFYDGERVYQRTRALLEICKTLGGLWLILYPLRVIPSAWRDSGYDWFAERRYRWFGKSETCRMPTPEERGRFLD